MDQITQAIEFAANAFDGRKRKVSHQPAILHSVETGAIASSMTQNKDVLCAAILHDVLEDTPVTEEILRQQFGDTVTDLVLSETENKYRDQPSELTWRRRKEEALQTLKSHQEKDVMIIFLSDKLSNIRSIHNDLILKGPSIWNEFNQKDPEEHHWYYRSMAQALSSLRNYPAWQEYDRLVAEVFQEEGSFHYDS
ncbi:MAG: HD domain-containing protein [Solobacterium sp.]|jgi:myo-inositol-1(or 4)-monophosphatase|nr:HD domain-containing protein [Solobacterium sp.]MCH4223013.1 HD domain-containing protein [Solobacterium sp.]